MNKKIGFFLITILFMGTLAQTSYSVSDDECMECHLEQDIEMEKNGRTISLHVKKYELKRSVHDKVKCIQCHKGFDPYEVPHRENIQPINCSNCHKDVYGKHKFHPKMEKASNDSKNDLINCKKCHGTHEILPSKYEKSPTNFLSFLRIRPWLR